MSGNKTQAVPMDVDDDCFIVDDPILTKKTSDDPDRVPTMEEVDAMEKRKKAKEERLLQLAEDRAASKLTLEGAAEQEQPLIEAGPARAIKQIVIVLDAEEPEPEPRVSRDPSPDQASPYDMYQAYREMSHPNNSGDEEQNTGRLEVRREYNRDQLARNAYNLSVVLGSEDSYDEEELSHVEDSQEALQRAADKRRRSESPVETPVEKPVETPAKKQREKAQARVKLGNPSEIPQAAGGTAQAVPAGAGAAQAVPAGAGAAQAIATAGDADEAAPAAAMGGPVPPPADGGVPVSPPADGGVPVSPAAGGGAPVPPDPNAAGAGIDMSALYAKGAILEPDIAGPFPKNFDNRIGFICGERSKSIFDLFNGMWLYEKKVSQEDWLCSDSTTMPLKVLATSYDVWADIDEAFPGRTEELDHPAWFSLLVKKCKYASFAKEERKNWQVNFWKIKPGNTELTFFFQCASNRNPNQTHDILVVDNKQRTLADIDSDWLFVKLKRDLSEAV